MTQRRAARAVALAALAVATVGSALDAVVAIPSAAGTPGAPSAAQAGDILRFAEQTAVVDPEGTFTMQLRAPGAPPGSSLRVVLHSRVSSRSQFAQTIVGESLGPAIRTVADTPLEELPRLGSDTFVVSIPIRDTSSDSSRIRLTNGGVYPVEVELLDADDVALDRAVSHLVRLPDPGDGSPALAVALIVPLRGQTALQADGTTALADDDRAGLLAIAAELLRQPELPLTLDPSPETLDALADGVEPGDDNLLATVGEAAAGREVTQVAYVPIEVGGWSGLVLGDALNRSLAAASAVVGERLADASAFDSAWVADATLNDQAVRLLSDVGIEQLVVSEASLAPLDADVFPRTLAQRFQVGSEDAALPAAMADAALTGHVGESGDPVLDAHHLLADLATIYFDEPPASRGVVVALPSGWDPDAEFLAPLLGGLSPSALFAPVGLSGWFATVPEAHADGSDTAEAPPLVRTLAAAPAPPLGAFAAQLAGAQGLLDTYRSMIDPDNPRAEPLQRRLLVAAAAGVAPERSSTYTNAVESAVQTELDHVTGPTDQTITLTGRTGHVPLVIHNDAGYPITVRLELESDRLEFPELPDGSQTLELVEPVTRVEIEVRARGSGDSLLDIALVSPDGRVELGRARFRVRSTAVSGVGLILSFGAGGFLVLWWARTIVRDRRRKKAA